jgi:hypothetical protein
VRTAGGHRRFRQEDVDELLRQTHSAGLPDAKLARERELETLLEVLVTLTGQLDLVELLAEIAYQATRLLNCEACMISEFDAASGTVRPLAEFDSKGRRLPDAPAYTIKDSPTVGRVLLQREPVVLTVNDPTADPAETNDMRSWSIKTLLMVPLANRGGAIGLLEVIDRERERRFSPQELRMARAVAASASVALQSARALARLQRSDSDARQFEEAVERMMAGLSEVCSAPTTADVLQATAALACEAFGCAFAIVGWADETASASHAGASFGDRPATPDDNGPHVLACRVPCAERYLSLTAAMHNPPGASLAGLARLLTSGAAWRIANLASTMKQRPAPGNQRKHDQETQRERAGISQTSHRRSPRN